MLVNQGLRGIPEQQLRDDEKSDVLFAVKSLLQDVTSVAVRRKLHDATTISTVRI